jgi:hypothetical protein
VGCKPGSRRGWDGLDLVLAGRMPQVRLAPTYLSVAEETNLVLIQPLPASALELSCSMARLTRRVAQAPNSNDLQAAEVPLS